MSKYFSNLILSKSKFNWIDSDGSQYIRRYVNKEFKPRYTIKTIKGSGGIMVCDCISWCGVSPIHLIEEIIKQGVYVVECVMLPFADMKKIYQLNGFVNRKMIWCILHIGKNVVSRQYCDILQQPSGSSDLNPIPHLWRHLKCKIKNKSATN